MIKRFVKWQLTIKMSPDTKDVFERLENEHPNIFNLCINLIFALEILLVIKSIHLISKYYYLYYQHCTIAEVHELKYFFTEIEHIDLAGVICGILGIIIAFLITLYVEKDHKLETEGLKSNSKKLSEATHEIHKISARILKEFTSFITVKDFTDRMNVMEEIINITAESSKNHSNQNHVYILNYNASYGHVQSYNTSITINDSVGRKTKVTSNESYHISHYKLFQNRQEKIFRDLKTKFDNQLLHFAILKTNLSDESPNEDKYRNLLHKVFRNEKVKIKTYCKTSSEKCLLLEISTKEDIYSLPLDENIPDITEKRKEELFIEKLVKDNATKIKQLNELNVNISYIDHVPFQFFVTAPDKMELGTTKQLCLIIFTNILSVQNTNSKTIAFKSESPELIQNLIDIHKSFTSRYNKELDEKSKFSRLFNISENKVNFVLKRIPDESKDRKEHDFLAYLSDIDCYSDLKELFTSKDFKVNLLYDDDDNLKKINLNVNEKKTYVVIGLFENKVTEIINNLPSDSEIGQNKRFFKIHRESSLDIEKNEWQVEDINIAQTNYENIIEDEENWKKYEKNDDHEYGLIAKIKIDNHKTFIICGGLTSFGTKQMGEYLKLNWDKIYDLTDQHDNRVEHNSFTILFEIPKNNENITLKVADVFVYKD